MAGHIVYTVQTYMVIRQRALRPTQLRAELEELSAAVDNLLGKMPDPKSSLAYEIGRQFCREYGHFPLAEPNRSVTSVKLAKIAALMTWPRFAIESLLWELRLFQDGINKLSIAEGGGGGRDADRPKYWLIGRLADFFESRTGKTIKRARDSSKEGNAVVGGPFGRLVLSINEHIPPEYQLGNIDNLIRGFLDARKFKKLIAQKNESAG